MLQFASTVARDTDEMGRVLLTEQRQSFVILMLLDQAMRR